MADVLNKMDFSCQSCIYQGFIISDVHKCTFLNFTFPLKGGCSYYKSKCHEGNHTVKEQKPDKWKSYGSAKCTTCNKYLGWYCPGNPKRFCEYDEENDPNLDCCIHCGAPEERK